MGRELQLSDLEGFLALPRVAVLATYRRDGTVLLSPVWHTWRDSGFDVLTEAKDVKVRHLRRDPRASIVVYDDEPPYRGVEIRTTATIAETATRDALRDVAVRYLGREAGEAYAAGSPECVRIRLEPGNVRAWDFADITP
ncbi:MAG TPA: TIGR03618 family F420-dependent PPOX class oxidoreductase [Gaiellaceae bacterium]|nr:TIGR03618 family F420-dependent PPOX class oxidoreductase [Gaiellaceae bacterium]